MSITLSQPNTTQISHGLIPVTNPVTGQTTLYELLQAPTGKFIDLSPAQSQPFQPLQTGKENPDSGQPSAEQSGDEGIIKRKCVITVVCTVIYMTLSFIIIAMIVFIPDLQINLSGAFGVGLAAALIMFCAVIQILFALQGSNQGRCDC